MQLDELPPEILVGVLGQIDNGADLVSVSNTNKTLYQACTYDNLWKPLCQRLGEKIQSCESIPKKSKEGKGEEYRKFYLEQMRINRHMHSLVNKLSDHSLSEQDKEAALEKVWSYGVRARDVLLDMSSDNETANKLVQMIKHKQAIYKLEDISQNPTEYEAVDLMTTVDSFYTEHELNPSKESIFGDIINEVRTSDDVKFCRSSRDIQKTATVLAEVLFDNIRVKSSTNSCDNRRSSCTSNLLTPVLEEGVQGADTVNSCVYSYIGSMYGLKISPVMFAQNGRFIDSNFARVDDPSKEEGYFLINLLSRVVLSGLDMAEMLEQQRSIRIVSMNSPPSLPVLAASTALKRSRPNTYSSQQEYINSLYASTALTYFFCQNNNDYNEYFERVQNSTTPKKDNDELSIMHIDHEQFEDEIVNEKIPSLYKQLLVKQ